MRGREINDQIFLVENIKILPPIVEPKHQVIMDELSDSIVYMHEVIAKACHEHKIKPDHISLYNCHRTIEELGKALSLCKLMYERPQILVSVP
jgi:hypothetical protein